MTSYAFPFRRILDKHFGTLDIDFVNEPDDFPLPNCGLMVFGSNNIFVTSEELDKHMILVKMWLATEGVWPNQYHISGTRFKTPRGKESVGIYFTDPEAYTMMKLKYG